MRTCSCCPRPAVGVVILLDGLAPLCAVCLADAVELGLVDPDGDPQCLVSDLVRLPSGGGDVR